MSLPPLRLNPAHETARYAEIYRRGGFVQITGLFEPAIATSIFSLFQNEIRWSLVYSDPEAGVVKLTAEDIQSIGRDGMAERMGKVLGLAAKNFGYCYNAYHMRDAVEAGQDPGHPIHDLTHFLRGAEMRQFMSEIIGIPDLTDIDVKATLFSPGNFLTRHVDDGDGRNDRVAAYTIGFSDNWQTDWGGLLLFLDPNTTNVTSGWVPRFNTLTVYNPKFVSSVSAVTAFAPSNRLSIEGWALKSA